MTLTLDLPPQLETLLRQRAETTGQDMGQIAIAVLTWGLNLNDEAFFAEQNQTLDISLGFPNLTETEIIQENEQRWQTFQQNRNSQDDCQK